MTSRKTRRRHGPARRDVEPLWLAPPVEEEVIAGRCRPAIKTIQLCRQVEDAVSCAFACSASALLRTLRVVGVEPVRGAAVVRVLVAMEGDTYDVARIHRALARARGYLRAEVALAIHRKRVPTLQVAVVPALESSTTAAPEGEHG